MFKVNVALTPDSVFLKCESRISEDTYNPLGWICSRLPCSCSLTHLTAWLTEDLSKAVPRRDKRVVFIAHIAH